MKKKNKILIALVIILILIAIAICNIFYLKSKIKNGELLKNKNNLYNISQNSNKLQGTNQVLDIKVGNKIFKAVLYDTDVVEKIAPNLKNITYSMNELNGNEKYYTFDKTFKSYDENVENIEAGDIMLYNSNTLVLFYDNCKNTGYTYTKIGRIVNVEGLKEALGTKDVNVSFNVE